MKNCEDIQSHPQSGSSKTVRFEDIDDFEEAQAQVDQIVGIMRVNVEKVLIRDAKLLDLTCRAQQLKNHSAVFQSQTAKLERKIQWKDTKIKIMIVCCFVLIIIGILFYFIFFKNSKIF